MTFFKTFFLRLGGCDYACSWCDSKYAVDPAYVREHAERLTIDDIIARLQALPFAPWVTLTGGNPALHHCDQLIDRLHAAGYKVAIETQGTIWRDWIPKCDSIAISPKPPSSGMATNYDQLENFIVRLSHHTSVCLKVVVFDETDMEYARAMVQRYPYVTTYWQCGTDPHDDRDTLLARYQALYEHILADESLVNVRPSLQLHVVLYGHKRGI